MFAPPLASTEVALRIAVCVIALSSGARAAPITGDPIASEVFAAVGDGKTDDTNALRNFFSAAGLSKSPEAPVALQLSRRERAFKITSGLTLDVMKGSLDGNGQTINCEHMTQEGPCLTLDAVTKDPLAVQYLNTREVRRLMIVAPSSTDRPKSVGVLLKNSLGGFNDELRISGLSILGGGTALLFGANAWGTMINGLSIGTDAANQVDKCLSFTVDYGGEPVIIDQGFLGNCNVAIDAPYSTSWVDLANLHIDGALTLVDQRGASVIKISNVYSELTRGDDSRPLFIQKDPDADLMLSNLDIGIRSDLVTRQTAPYFAIDGTVEVSNLTFTSGAPGVPYRAGQGFLVGSGRGHIHAPPGAIHYRNFAWAPLRDKRSTWNAFPDMNSPQALAGFTLVGSDSASRPRRESACTDSRITRDCLVLALPARSKAGAISSAEWRQDVAGMSGYRVSLVGQCFADLRDSGAKVDATFAYKDAAGGVFEGWPKTRSIFAAGTNHAHWETIGADGEEVPPGAKTLEASLTLSATRNTANAAVVRCSPVALGYP